MFFSRVFANSPKFKIKGLQFRIQHYAGRVKYRYYNINSQGPGWELLLPKGCFFAFFGLLHFLDFYKKTGPWELKINNNTGCMF